MTTHRTPRRTPGFTLIEMAVVLAIIGLMMAAVMPSVGTWMRNLRIRNQSESIQNGLQQARAEAVRRNTPVTFWLVSLTNNTKLDNNCAKSATGTSWVVSLDDPAGLCGSAPSSTTSPRIVAAHNAGDGGGTVTVSATEVDGTTATNKVTFDGFGRMTDAANDVQMIALGYATAVSGDRPLRVEITPAGQVRMCDPAVSTTASPPDPRACAY